MAALMHRVILLSVALLALAAYEASAQTVNKQDQLPSARPPERPGGMGTPEQEMLRRAAIRHEEESHREMVERADEAAALGEQILDSFKKNNYLTRDDLKKLERMEKLVRKIRGGAGGSDDKEELQDPPGLLGGAISRIAEISGLLKKSVMKTSRLVISAAVIERSNELIELIKHIRSNKQP